MEMRRLGDRAVQYSFPDLEGVNLLAIYGRHRTYLCDTFLGPEPMELVRAAVGADGRHQPVVVFNSHSHWDHVWGNCAFDGSLIVAHQLCRRRLLEDFEREFADYGGQAQGVVVPCFPNLLFTDRLRFEDDAVEFFFSPGHTEDSASCLDLRDNVLFVGDNVEEPFPYVQSPDLMAYQSTLEHYLALAPVAYVAGHGREFPRSLIQANLDYIQRLAAGDETASDWWSDGLRERHRQNLRVLGR